MRLFWGVLSSIGTTIVLVWSFALMIGLASAVKQNASIPDILESYPFAAGQAVLGLGWHRFWTAWPTLLVLLLLTVNGVGLLLRYGWGVSRAERARRPWWGPGVVARQKRYQTSNDQSLNTIGAQLNHADKAWQRTESQLWMVRGLWVEGCLCLLLGLITLMAGGVLNSIQGLDARLTVIETDSASRLTGQAEMKMNVQKEGHWLEQTPPFSMQCQPPDPLDVGRQRECTVFAGRNAQKIILGFHRDVEALGLHFRLLSERPVPMHGPPMVLLDTPEGGGLRRLGGAQGHGYRLSNGVQYTTFVGPDGPLIVKSAASEKALLLVPTVTPGLPKHPETVNMLGIPPWEIDVSVKRRPARYLFGAGFLLLLGGLLSLLLFPHLVVVAWQEKSFVMLTAYSFNRVKAVDQLIEAFEQVLPMDAGDGEGT